MFPICEKRWNRHRFHALEYVLTNNLNLNGGGRMKTNFFRWLTGSAVVMLLLPWAAVTFVNSNAGMAVTLLLFFVIDPVYVIVAGTFVGRNIKGLWSVPVIAVVMFLLSAWKIFDMGEGAFAYAGFYLAIGLVSMFLSSWIGRRKQR